jgi:hypothetical protein
MYLINKEELAKTPVIQLKIRIIMSLTKLTSQMTVFSFFVLFSVISTATFAEDHKYPQFSGDTANSKLKMNFTPVNQLLDANVINMGPSKRASAKRAKPPIGTRARSHVAIATHNESNRFTYELIHGDKHEGKVNDVKSYLESLPVKSPLNLYSKKEQLAYWLNLYNVTLINEIVKRYPRTQLKKLLTGTDSVLNKKLISIDNVKLSLNDIQHDILDKNYDKDPLIIYGLYQGNIGSPNINKKAYSGKNVYKLLTQNAAEFINSNRGTRASNSTLAVSSYYARNLEYFPDFDNDLKSHLLQFSDKKTRKQIKRSDIVEPSINNWQIADLFGSTRVFGGSVSINPAAMLGAGDPARTAFVMRDANGGGKYNLSQVQLKRLQGLLRVRAKNFGTTSVTVKDLEPEEEN